MLQQNFQTPEALGLTASQHRALVLTLNALERGELRPGDIDEDTPERPTSIFTGHFNMDVWCSAESCGTVGCIGGTAEMLGGLAYKSLDKATRTNRALDGLLYPAGIDGWDWENITIDHAAKALRAYLTFGQADWSTT